MTLEGYIILFIVTFIGGLVQGISGFAFGMVVLLVLPYFFSYADSLVLLLFMSTYTTGINAFLYRKKVNWGVLPQGLIAFTVGNLGAIKILKQTADSPIWLKLLGVMFIFMAFYQIYWQGKIKVRPSLLSAASFCGLSGIVTGLFGVGGPIMVLYFLAIAKDKEEYIGTVQMFGLITIMIDLSIRTVNGMVSLPLIQFGLWCVWSSLLGLYVGKKLFDKMDGSTLQKVVCGIMVLNGIGLLLQ